MKRLITSWLVGGYVLLSIILGGSAQSAWTNLALQILGVAFIAWASICGARNGLSRDAFAFDVLLVCGMFVVLVQLIPLPTNIWSALPGREIVSVGLGQLGIPLAPAPISLMPYNSVLTLFAAIPAIAVLAATERLQPSPRATGYAIVAGMIAAVLVGAIQVAGGPESKAYFYQVHSPGAIGFFANGNHMATLLLISIPMAAALLTSRSSMDRISPFLRHALGLAFVAFVLLGIVLNGSRAAVGLFVPVTIATASLFPVMVRWRRAALALSIVTLIAGVAVIVSNPLNSEEFTVNGSPSATTRGEIWSRTAEAIHDTFPVGTGLGTFQDVYHRYEDLDQVSNDYVNHAHNDYLEVAMELGAGGILLMIAFFGWWANTVIRVWRTPATTQFAKAATIVTATILAHSLVDFPLRTSAISAIFGGCIALMTQRLAPTPVSARGEAGRARHVRLG